jgi:glycosyltransferase involved in cell wall biosynthesis
MRILYHHRTAAQDGMRVHIDSLIGALRADGHEVLVVGPGGTEDHKYDTEKLADILRSGLPKAAAECLEILYNILALCRLDASYKRFKPDILYERYNLFLLAGLWLRRRRQIPLLLEVNSPLVSERSNHGGIALRRLAAQLERTAWQRADAVLPVTEVLAAHIASQIGTRQTIHTIQNGVDLERFRSNNLREELRARHSLQSKIVLGFSGFMRDWHGLDWAIDALEALPANVALFIVGEGPAEIRLRALAKERGAAQRVLFAGRVPHESVPDYLAAFDVALQPRAVPYASPLKLFEYMASSLAIVAPDQANIREIVGDGVSALLFAPDNRSAFLSAVQRLCLDPELRTTLGKAARLRLETVPFTWRANARRVAEIARALSPAGAPFHPAYQKEVTT